MANTPRHGRNALIMLDTSSAGNGSAAAISGKNKWSVDNSIDTVETTAFQDPTKTFVAGLPNNSGDMSGFWDSADTNIYNVIGSSVPRKLYIYPDNVNNVTTYFFTTAYVGVKHEGGTGEAVAFTGTWTGATSGAWVHP